MSRPRPFIATLGLVLLGAGCGPRPTPAPVAASGSGPASIPAKVEPRARAAPGGPAIKGRPAEKPSTAVEKAAEARYWKGRQDLIRPPEPRPAAPLATLGLERTRLPNGLRVSLLPDLTMPLVDVQLLVLAGGIDEPKGKVGLAEFTAAMLRHGTKRLTADALSKKLDSAGAYLSVSSAYETTTLSCGGRARILDLCLEILSEIALSPIFPEGEMSEIRDQLLGAVKQTRDDPGTLAELHFLNLLYGDERPGGRPLTAQSIGRIARSDLASFHSGRFLPGSSLLGLSGAVDRRTALAKVKRAFGPWTGGAAPNREVKPVEQPSPGLRVLLVDKPDLSQAYFTLGHAGIQRTCPAKDAVSVMNYVLGGGSFSSRLMKVVRSEGGKTYGISSAFETATVDGTFHVSSFTRNAEFLSTLRLVQGEMARLASTAPPTAEEVRGAKGKVAGGFVIRYQTTSRLLSSLLHAEIFGLPATDVTEFPIRIERLSLEEVGRAARERLHPGQLVVAVVGRAKELAEQLRKEKIPFEGPIHYLDPISAEERAARKKTSLK